MILAFDTEDTGLDLYHEARPFYFVTCDEKGEQIVYEWDVDPKTRKIIQQTDEYDIRDDIRDIQELLHSADVLVTQNGKFDVTALAAIGITDFPWEKLEDTLIAGHLLYSAKGHRLDQMTMQYLDEDITKAEKVLIAAVQEARRLVTSEKFREVYGKWKIAKRGDPGMPSAKEKCYGYDFWLPLAIAKECEYPPDHPYWTVLEKYAKPDPYWTLRLWFEMEPLIRGRDLWEIYRERMKVLPIAHRMERRGVTVSGERIKALVEDFQGERRTHDQHLVSIARDHKFNLVMPQSGNNDSLIDFVFRVLKVPVVKMGKESPSLDKEVLEEYVKELPVGHPATEFLELLQRRRKLDTGLQYLAGYQRYWIPLGIRNKKGEELWYLMHQSLNPTGTVQLRWSSSNPNTQNISKQEGFNLRQGFAPLPGEEDWSLDAQNIELRIPAFRGKEPALMDVFLRPKDPPYFGSYHLVVFDLLHPDLFKQYGVKCKDVFESTWYQWVKNGNFSFIYGAQRKKCDATFKVPGAFDLIRDRFPNIAKLSDEQFRLAKKFGYVETVPDKTVNPRRGFPIQASRTDDGSVMPTTPLNYHVSGTAMWWTMKAMIRCEEQLMQWRQEGFDAYMKLQVHDELVFAMPASKRSPSEDLEKEKRVGGPLPSLKYYRSNLGRVRVLQKLMEEGGNDIGLPTPVGVEYNRDNWAEVTLKC